MARLSDAGRSATAAGMRLHAERTGLNYTNVRPVATIPTMKELNIGHAIVSRAVMVGMKEAVVMTPGHHWLAQRRSRTRSSECGCTMMQLSPRRANSIAVATRKHAST